MVDWRMLALQAVALRLVCPQCGAAEGKRCRNRSGKPAATCRQRLALAADWIGGAPGSRAAPNTAVLASVQLLLWKDGDDVAEL